MKAKKVYEFINPRARVFKKTDAGVILPTETLEYYKAWIDEFFGDGIEYDVIMNNEKTQDFEIEILYDIDMSELDIEEIPPKITRFDGYLDLRNSTIKKINPIYVNDFFSIANTEIKEIPYNCSFAGDVELANTLITRLPDNFNNGLIEQDLILTKTNIETLPENLTIEGDLGIQYCSKLKYLPDTLKVKYEIHIDFETYNHVEIPDHLKRKIDIIG